MHRTTHSRSSVSRRVEVMARAVAEEATTSCDEGATPLESRWQVARTMCAAYVLCNMDKVRPSGP